MRFDLTEQPWIPVRGPDGAERDVGLRELFATADQLSDIAVPFAPERVAVTRILVAVLQAATRGPYDRAERIAWLEDPGPVQGEVGRYLGTWKAGFDLFDDERPFMQRPLDDEAKETTVAALRLDWSSGNNATLFDHHHDDERPALTAGEAARALLTTLLHQPGGGVAKPFNRTDSPGSKPLLVLPLGRTVWETLVLNSVEYEESAVDAPIWERYDEDHVPDPAGTMPRGWLDRLTWRSRAIRLIADADGAVRACRIQQHLKLADGSLGDPHAAVIRKTGEDDRIVRLSAGKRLWRQADAILRGVGGSPRSAVDQAVRTAKEHDGHHPQMLVSGLQVDQAKIGDAQSAVLPVSVELLADPTRIERVRQATELAEQASVALGAACGAFHRARNVESPPAARTHWQQPFWARLEREFRPLIEQYARPDVDLSPSGRPWMDWQDAVGRVAQRTLEQQLSAAPVGAAHRAHVRATNAFRWRCRQAGVPLPARRPLEPSEAAELEPSTTTTGTA